MCLYPSYMHIHVSHLNTHLRLIYTHTYTSVHPQAYVCTYIHTCIPFMHLHTPSCKPIHSTVHILKYLYAGRHKIPIYPYTHLYLHNLYIGKYHYMNTDTYPHIYRCLVVQYCLTLCNPMDCSLPGSSVQGDAPGKKTGVGFHALLQRNLPKSGI